MVQRHALGSMLPSPWRWGAIRSVLLEPNRRVHVSFQHDMHQIIDAAQRSQRFEARVAAIDLLELCVLDRLAHLERQAALGAEQQLLRGRATALRARLESANERTLQRLASRVRARRYTRAGLHRVLTRLSAAAVEHDYDAADVLVAGLLDAGALPLERASREPDMVAYQPTPARVVLSALELAAVDSDDVLIDLGSGLGWVVILTALLTGARARGVEFEPVYCDYARACVNRLGLGSVEIMHADAREATLSDGTVFFMYTPFRGAMLDRVLERLRREAYARTFRICAYGPCTKEVERADWLRARHQVGQGDETLGVFDSVSVFGAVER